MKENRLVVFTVLLLLSAAVFQLPAQQNEAHRKSSADISSKAETSDAEWVKSYRKAAEQNDAIAQFNLAFAYANGRGVAKDDAEAVKWYRRAAEQNLAQAQYNLGFAYANGRGVAKNYAQAVKWLRKTAGHSNVQAETALGYCYATGQGVAKEHTEAAKWYRKAAAATPPLASLFVRSLAYQMNVTLPATVLVLAL